MKLLRNCARCKQDHEGVELRPLTHPIVDDDGTTWTHWAPCPTNGEPIIVRKRPKPGTRENPIVAVVEP